MNRVEDYADIVGYQAIEDIFKRSRRLVGKSAVHINSTFIGGGVAEILRSLAPLMNSCGLEADWRVLHGYPDFFTITKKFHNALQGDEINFSEIKQQIYHEVSEEFASYAKLDYDCIIIHDPQPLPLVKYMKKRQPWVWRCHVDLSSPNALVWDYLKRMVIKYDLMVVSHEDYLQTDFPLGQRIVHPAIDPLRPKNLDLPDEAIRQTLEKAGVPLDKPLLTQISRFDKWKDPEGVVEVFELVRAKRDCRLVMMGGMAADDPEGAKIYDNIRERHAALIERGDLILIVTENDILANALQRMAKVVIQKSLREGFCLAVTEALWKGTPVAASRIGGIPLQVQDGVNGYLLDPRDNAGFAERITALLSDDKLRARMGEQGRETVRKKFLITRLLADWLDIVTLLTDDYHH